MVVYEVQKAGAWREMRADGVLIGLVHRASATSWWSHPMAVVDGLMRDTGERQRHRRFHEAVKAIREQHIESGCCGACGQLTEPGEAHDCDLDDRIPTQHGTSTREAN